jgi:hypothetical protein
VEALANAFLGVLMPEVELQAAPKFKRGRRFDWLNDQMVTTGRLKSLLSRNLDLPDLVWNRLRSETNHELRAALICLLTAALASKGTAAIIGEAEGGWFWLPPWSLWQPWATKGLEIDSKKMASKVTTVLDRPFRWVYNRRTLFSIRLYPAKWIGVLFFLKSQKEMASGCANEVYAFPPIREPRPHLICSSSGLNSSSRAGICGPR